MTLQEAQLHARRTLENSAELRNTAALDAALLLRHVLRLSAAQVLAHPERSLSLAERHALEAAIARRLTHEPVQYITGEVEFYGLPLHVSPAVLIPRPETELLVEAVLSELQSLGATPLCIADVGTGSGAIAVALATPLPLARVTAVDLSPAALEIARKNITRHGLTARVRALESDLLSTLADQPQLDAVVSNPPYVPEVDRLTIHPQVRDYEPSIALFAGPDGLDIYRRLIPQAHARLKPGGLLAMELGFDQQPLLEELLAGWDRVRFLPDLQGIPRVVLARR